MTLQDRLKAKTRGLALPAFPAKKLTEEAEDKLTPEEKLNYATWRRNTPDRKDKQDESFNQAISEMEKAIKEYCGVEG